MMIHLAPQEPATGISQKCVTFFSKSSFRVFRDACECPIQLIIEVQVYTLMIKKTRGQNIFWEASLNFLKMGGRPQNVNLQISLLLIRGISSN